MIETGVSRPEVVQREAASHRLKIRGDAARCGHVLRDCAFGDFNGSAFKGKPRVLRELPDMSRQIQILQLQRRDIECQPATLSMESARSKCRLQDLAAELADQSMFLRHGDEKIWRDHAEFRVLPACENLKA